MPAIYHPGVIQTAAHYNIGAPHDAVNVFHWLGPPGAYSISELTAVQTMFNTWWSVIAVGWMATGTQYKGCIVTDMSTDTGLQVRNDTYSPLSGTVTGGPLSDAACVLLSLKTAKRYRGGHGRIYIPGIAMGATQSDGRTVDSSRQTSQDNAYKALVTNMATIPFAGGTGVQPIVWHKRLSSAPNTVEVVIAGIHQTVLANQRRRLRRVSRHRRRIP